MDPFLVELRTGHIDNATSLLCNSWSSTWMTSCTLLVTAVLGYARDNTGVSENDILFMLDELLANFLFCDQFILRERNMSFEGCVNATGLSFGLCHSAYPGFSNNSDFQDCFDLIHNSPLGNTPIVDILSFISKTCQLLNNTDNIDVCRTTRLIQYSVFDIKEKYDVTLNTFFAYIYPSTLAVALFMNLLLLVALVRKFKVTTYFLLLGAQCTLECLFSMSMLPVLLTMFSFDIFSSDYMDVALCRLLFVCSSVVPGIMHGVAVLLTIGLLLQRYIIVAYPFKIRVYDKKKYVFMFIMFSCAWCTAFYIPDIYEIVNLKTLHIMSKLDPQVTVETVIMYRSKELSRNNILALSGRLVFMYLLPNLLSMILVVKFFRLLQTRRKAQLALRGKAPAADPYQFLSRMTIFIVTSFLFIEIPNCFALILIILINLKIETSIEFDVKIMSVVVNNLSAITFIIKSSICLFSTKKHTYRGTTSRNSKKLKVKISNLPDTEVCDVK